jgi:hypothetical protein
MTSILCISPIVISFKVLNQKKIGLDKNRQALPDQPCMSRFYLRLKSLDLVEKFGNIVLTTQIIYAKRINLIKDEVTLIADYTEEPCKKDKNDPYCFGTKEGKTNHKTLVFSLISGDFHIIIATYKIQKNQHKLPIFEEVLHILKENSIIPHYFLLDRGFYRKELLDYLRSHDITVIMPGRKCTDTDKRIHLWLQDKSGRSGKISLKLKYVKKFGWKTMRMGYVLVGKRGFNLQEVKKDYKGGKISLSTASSRIFPLLIIRGNKRSVKILDGNANYIRSLYRRRWEIEIAFRENNRLGISNRIQNRSIRLFRFTMGCVIYNTWQIYRYLFSKYKSDGGVLSLDEFCGKLNKNRGNYSIMKKHLEVLGI